MVIRWAWMLTGDSQRETRMQRKTLTLALPLKVAHTWDAIVGLKLVSAYINIQSNVKNRIKNIA